MSNSNKCYLAGTGMITSVGAHSKMSCMSVRAGVSGYKTSDISTRNGENITMALIPDDVFSQIKLSEEIDQGQYYNEQYDHIIKMAVIALREVLNNPHIKETVPLLLAMPDGAYPFESIPSSLILKNLAGQSDLLIDRDQTRSLYAGRAGGLLQVDLAIRYLYEQNKDLVVIGGSDSYIFEPLIAMLDEAGRLLTASNNDGFAPGEGAAFLLLTADPNKAITRNGHIIAIHAPGISEEPGNILSEEPYKGDGLDESFNNSLANFTGPSISSIYSSMNGERYWAKEFGVAYIRNQQYILNEFDHQHPADCWGDLGSATGPALVILAANQLFAQSGPGSYLVYSSSDSAWRAAIRLEKVACSRQA